MVMHKLIYRRGRLVSNPPPYDSQASLKVKENATELEVYVVSHILGGKKIEMFKK